jgi:hypothetical protein
VWRRTLALRADLGALGDDHARAGALGVVLAHQVGGHVARLGGAHPGHGCHEHAVAGGEGGQRELPLDELTRQALLAWLDYRRSRWPNTANPHLLLTQHTAMETSPVGKLWVTNAARPLLQTAAETPEPP